MTKKVHVIHHTHWDFEWYFTNNESFIQFVYHMDEVLQALEEQKIAYYLLDGQMSILDEYLATCPEQAPRIERLVRANRLQIGPWYTQTDELIIAGESIVRNLNMGIAQANKLGGAMKIGYLPDSFGQGKDMPKIYNGFGMTEAVFWRGVSRKQTRAREFQWASEDGSVVTVANIKDGYFVGVGLIEQDVNETMLTQIADGATGDELLLPVGGDQRYVDYQLGERISAYNKAFSGQYELVESSYQAFFKALDTEKIPLLKGELVDGAVSKIHRSIYSSRYDHKQWNDKLERRLIYQLEPLLVRAEQAGLATKKGVVARIWKLLCKNQAHDSAGGCNSDKTNRIINERYREADQLSQGMIDYVTRKLSETSPSIKAGDLTFYNTLPWTVAKVVHVAVSSPFKQLTIRRDGKPLPFDCLQTTRAASGPLPHAELNDSSYYVHQLAIAVSVPPLGSQTYTIEAGQTKKQVQTTSTVMITNARYELSYQDGQLNLFDKITKQHFFDFLTIEDSGDAGDTYDYSPPLTDDCYHLRFEAADVNAIHGAVQETLTLTGEWLVANNLAERAQQQRKTRLPYRLTLTLHATAQTLNVEIIIDNNADDHRMRVLIASNLTNEVSYADTPFGMITRPVVDSALHNWREQGWCEEPTSLYPMLHYVNVHSDKRSLTIFAKGIKEYQLVGEQYQTLALTLFRSVGYLGKPNLQRRPGAASGNAFREIATPDSQLQQRLHFQFALQLDEQFKPAQLQKDYLNYAINLPYYQKQTLNRFTTALQYFVAHPLANMQPTTPFIFESETVVWSSLRQTDESKGFEVRCYNPSLSAAVAGGTLRFETPIAYVAVDLKGTILGERARGRTLELGHFKAGEIKTFRIDV